VVVEQLSKIDIPALVARFPDPQDPDLKNNMAKNLEGVQQVDKGVRSWLKRASCVLVSRTRQVGWSIDTSTSWICPD